MSATTNDKDPVNSPAPPRGRSSDISASWPQQGVRLLLSNRVVLLAVLLVVVVVVFSVMSLTGSLGGDYNSDYLSASLINLTPLAMLALAQLMVIVSGAGGIDLSVGAIVSVAGMVFGILYGVWGWSLPISIILTVGIGALFGLVNGFLIAYIGYPALIVTLATYYILWSISLVITNQKPISTGPIQEFYALSQSVEIPVIGGSLPLVPLGVFLFLFPTVLVVWFVLAQTVYGRRLYAIGTNDIAASWAGVNVARTRALAYVASGAISGLVAVATVSQFASARPDSGVSGNGLALPAITMAVLGGVAISGGVGRVLGVLLASLLIVWLNAGILLAFEGNAGTQIQLLALGLILIGAALLNGITNRRFAGTR